MLNGIKLIGVCLTRLEDESSRDLLKPLQREAEACGARLLVFNSFLDFFYENDYERGAKSIYSLIPYDLLDALVILDECFFDKELVRQMIAMGNAHGIPVVSVYGEYEGCFCIRKEYDAAYSALVRHVIMDHGVRSVRYIAGTRGKNYTEKRLSIFRRVMQECGLKAEDDDIAYCDDWFGPVNTTIDRWVAAGEVPEAIICASDMMAGAAIDRLRENGIHVPQDVIVTGFDGLQSMRLHSPRLTTCVQDLTGTASLILRAIRDALEDGVSPYSVDEQYHFDVSESCGCHHEYSGDGRKLAEYFFHSLDTSLQHENYMFTWADRLLTTTDVSTISNAMQKVILANSVLVLNGMSNSLELGTPDVPFGERVLVIPAPPEGAPAMTVHEANAASLLTTLADAVAGSGMIIFQSIYVADKVCGYYAACVNDIHEQAHSIRRICRITNLAFSAIVSRMHQAQMVRRMAQMQSRDALTGLLNLRGLTTHVTDNYEDLSGFCISVSVYVINRYQQMLEDNGLEAMEKAVLRVAELLQASNPGRVLLARVSESDFVVVNLEKTHEDVSQAISQSVDSFFGALEAFNRAHGDEPALEINCGCVVSRPGWNNNLMSYIKAANGEMYLNRMKNNLQPARRDEVPQVESDLMFQLLLEQNLFRYHFQPIVDAHTGDIVGYEALMRTIDPIRLQPGQILDIAQKRHRLYDIERATLFNVMEYIDAHQELFAERRVFINTIPGYFLNDEDRSMLTSRYSHLLPSCTIEITESNDTDDAELMQLHLLEHNGESCQLAIDDYGTGFSNIVNLLRYQPQVIKIDRFLIDGVDRDSNKQLFIRSTVEFAKMNGILVLAEGVERQEELSKVIELGVDLVQGFYLARPSAEVIPYIPANIQHFIIEETLRFSRFGSEKKLLRASDGDELDLLNLAVNKVTDVQISGGKVTVRGRADHYINIAFTTAPGTESTLVLKNVYLGGDRPAITLGDDSRVTLEVLGENTFRNVGIRVPQSAHISIVGTGALNIRSLQRKGTVLGGSPSESYGHIVVDMTGRLNIQAENENSVCIGGGHKDYAEPIELRSGTIRLEALGVRSVAAGCMNGVAEVKVGRDATLLLHVVGNEAVALGTLAGHADIDCEGSIDMTVDGERLVGIGVLGRGTGSVMLRGSLVRALMRGAHAVSIGSQEGNVKIRQECGLTDIRMEGAEACGIGSVLIPGASTLAGGEVRIEINSSSPSHLGEAPVIISGCVQIRGDKCVIDAVNAFGEPLCLHRVKAADSVEIPVSTPGGSYTYHAKRSTNGELCVYLPEGCVIS